MVGHMGGQRFSAKQHLSRGTVGQGRVCWIGARCDGWGLGVRMSHDQDGRHAHIW